MSGDGSIALKIIDELAERNVVGAVLLAHPPSMPRTTREEVAAWVMSC